jgi:hypothetical protein
MKTVLVATSAFALIATMSIALAQAPKGEGGQKEMSQPPMKEGLSAEKDAPKAGEKKEVPADKKAQQDKAPKDAAKDTAKDGKKEPDKERASKDAPKDGKKEADKDKGSKDASKETAGKDKATKEGKGGTTLSQEQRTKVQGSFAKHKGKSANVNITVNVGVAVPRSVQLYAIPEDIVVIVPAYRRYRYFIVGDRVCIVDPDTYEIVEIIVIA